MKIIEIVLKSRITCQKQLSELDFIMILWGSKRFSHSFGRIKIYLRYYTSQKTAEAPKKYTETINLPKTKFPSRLSASKRAVVGNDILERCSGLYNYQRLHHRGPEFVLHDGPPYANGDLHMGHVVNKVLKDITTRSHVVNGHKVHYKPGWDCHGLPIELKATQKLKCASPLEIRNASRSFASKTIEQQKSEFKKWSVMADWENQDNRYQTFDASYIINQLKIFLDFYEKGFIYRDVKPVYWSPSSRSALAEAELEYDPNFVNPSVLLKLRFVKKPAQLENFNNVFAVIWTTTPWTLPANQAICYNPNLNYSVVKINEHNDDCSYVIATDLLKDFEEKVASLVEVVQTFSGDHLHGTSYLHPINSDEVLPILPGDHVQSSKGTGLVHTAPAHGPEDFLISLQNGLKIKNLVDANGKYTEEAPDFLKSKSVLQHGNELVLKYLENSLLFSGKITHSYPIDWRTKKPVILRASEQWFINTEKLKEKAVAALENVKIYPKTQSENNRKVLLTQLEKRPYWCISRQRVWGVPIPVIYDDSTKKPIINEKLVNRLCSLVEQNGNFDFWWDKTAEEILGSDLLEELNLKGKGVKKGEDILDIWFDSGVSWSYALENDKVADVYLEGIDQFTGWFQSSLLTSIAYRNAAPYKSIFVHGFAVDENGHKMSKSLGNIIYPKDFIQKYGIDSVRWWVASHATQNTSIVVSNHLLQAASENLNKLRAILKYHLGVIDGQKSDDPMKNYKLNVLDKFYLNELYKFNEEARKLYESFEYNRITALVHNFVNNQVSSIYLHLIKDRLYCDTDENYLAIKYILTQSFYILCKVLWPIIPTLIEESWSYHDENPFYTTSIDSSKTWINHEAVKIMELANVLRDRLHQQVKDVNTWTLNLTIITNKDNFNVIKELHLKDDSQPTRIASSELCELLQVGSVLLKVDDSLELTGDWKINVDFVNNNLCPRCRRFSINDQETLCCRCDEVLRNKMGPS